MKSKYRISLLFFLHGFLLFVNTEAQNIRNDTVYVNTESAVELVFKSRSNGKLLQGDGSIEVKDGTNTSLVIRALKKEVADQPLEVTEGKRVHRFILSYKDPLPANRIDWSDVRKLKAYVTEKEKNVSKELNEANKLNDQAKLDLNNQALWENVEAKYQRLVNAVDSKDASFVKSRLEESRTQIKNIKGKKFDEAIKEGLNYYSSKNYGDARKAYLKALHNRPKDVQALKYLNLTDSVWAKEYVEKGDEANKLKKYVDTKAYYKEALNIKPDYPSLQSKYNQIKLKADPLIYKIEKEKGDQALRANDSEEARRAYDSALSVSPGDRYIQNQLKKLIIEEEKIEQEEKKEAAYQGILASAKSLADKASDVQGYELAIKEYQRALTVIPTRKFPLKKIDELTKIKNAVSKN